MYLSRELRYDELSPLVQSKREKCYKTTLPRSCMYHDKIINKLPATYRLNTSRLKRDTEMTSDPILLCFARVLSIDT